jgi:hypothetical protein
VVYIFAHAPDDGFPDPDQPAGSITKSFSPAVEQAGRDVTGAGGSTKEIRNHE